MMGATSPHPREVNPPARNRQGDWRTLTSKSTAYHKPPAACSDERRAAEAATDECGTTESTETSKGVEAAHAKSETVETESAVERERVEAERRREGHRTERRCIHGLHGHDLRLHHHGLRGDDLRLHDAAADSVTATERGAAETDRALGVGGSGDGEKGGKGNGEFLHGNLL